MPLLITVILLAAVTTPAMAGKWVSAQKAPFYEASNCSSDQVTGVVTDGEVNIVDPMGNVSLIIQGKVRGLEPYTQYDAWVRDLAGYTGDYLFSYPSLGYFKLATFMTDEYGDGNFHINLRSEDLPDGDYQIQVAVNNTDGYTNNIGCTYLATQKYLGVSVKSE